MSTKSEDSVIPNERKLGLRLAKKYNASKTLEIIKDISSSMEDILRVAADEVGLDQLFEVVTNERPEWSFALLQVMPSGKHREKLGKEIGKKLIDSSPLNKAIANAEQVLKPVKGLALHISGGVGGACYSCRYTMVWQSAENVLQPFAAYPDSSEWLFSRELLVNQSQSITCLEFANHNPKSPLKPGDPIVMLVWIVSGDHVYAGGSLQAFKFKYDPTASAYLSLIGTGTTGNPIFKERP